MRRGKSQAQASLNRALDDLLGGDDDDPPAAKPRFGSKSPSSTTGSKKSGPHPKKALTSNSSSKDFYSSLSALAGHDVVENEDEEDIELKPEDAAQMARSLADMDDLESDLFGSFGGKKIAPKSKGSSSLFSSKHKKKSQDIPDFDEDDPLAGLGLSDDEDTFKGKSKKPEISRKLSQTSNKAKVDPNLGASNIQESKTSPIRSSSFDKEDPFLATDPRPRSGSGGEKMMKRLNSWDDPSLGTQSESELTPRSRSNSGTQLKHSRKGSSKKKVNPTPAKTDGGNSISQGASLSPRDAIDMLDNPVLKAASERTENNNKKKIDDIFTDDDDLPGLSGDEMSSPTKKQLVKKIEDVEPVRKATLALDDLLGGRSKAGEAKSRRPTFLDQMMSKPGGKEKTSDLPIETESPITSPREKEVKFGGYSPSVGTSRERPTTAPNKRSVRFADELGFDELDFSMSESRPSSAPDSGRSKKSKSRSKDFSAGSSFEDENTDVSLDLSTNDFKKSSTAKSAKAKSKAGQVKRTDSKDQTNGVDSLGLKGELDEKKTREVKSPEAVKTSPRRALQNSRRTTAGLTRQTSQDDWLGLTDDNTSFPANTHEISAGIPNDQEEQKTFNPTKEASNDDWLGLGEETAIDVTAVSRSQAASTKDKDRVSKQAKNPGILPEDELFPWETPDRSGRQRRRNDKVHNERSIGKTEETQLETGLQQNSSSIKEPISHSTPVQNERSNLERSTVESSVNQGKGEHRKQPVSFDRPPSREQPKDHQPVPLRVNEDQNASVTSIAQQMQVNQSVLPVVQGGQQMLVNYPQAHLQQVATQQTISQDSNPVPLYAQGNASQVGLQDALLAKLLAAQNIASLPGIPPGLQLKALQEGTVSRSNNGSLLAMQIEKLNAEKTLHQHKIEEYEISQSQSEQDRKDLESELRDLQSKVSSIEEMKIKQNFDYAKKIGDLENSVRILESEKEHLMNSQEMLKKRHHDEIKATENSCKSRLKILEDTYQRRESQIKEDSDFLVKQLNDRIKLMETEKNELIAVNKERISIIEKNKEADIERVKDLHKKSLEDVRKDYEEQLERLRLLKEQEVAAATSMFSQTKSLQSLIQQVHNSASEMEHLQKRMDFSHKDGLHERENSLRMRDEYLKTMQERLHRQETENTEERSRLQALVAKLEMQLREQGRQLEQSKWKLTQDENRILSLQAAVEEERRYTMQQLNSERQMVEKSRDDLMAEQRKILSELHEERRKITIEKAEIERFQTACNKESLEKEYANLKERELKISTEEERLDRERTALEQSYKRINAEKETLEEFAKQIQSKSKEVEILSKQAVKMQQEGIESLEHCHTLKNEIANASSLLDARASQLEQKESSLAEQLASIEIAKTQFGSAKINSCCVQCRRPINGTLMTDVQLPSGSDISSQQLQPFLEQQPKDTSSPPLSTISSSIIAVSSINENQKEPPNQVEAPWLQPPDILLGSLNFNRAVRKWSVAKEQDEEFFEEETKYLNEIQKRREAKLASIT